VVSPGTTVGGKPISQYTADWWNWAGASNVIGDPDGSAANNNQSGSVFFVAGTSSNAAPVVTRNFTVPAGKFVLFPLVNWIIANGADPGFTDTQSEAFAITTGTIDPSKLVASVDGQDVPNLFSHRVMSPVNFSFTTSGTNTPFPPGTYTDANGDGYWIMLEPLSAGKHTLHFGGTTVDYTGPDPLVKIPSFTVDTTAVVTVGGSAIPLPPGVLAAIPAFALAALQLRRARRKR